jgi:rSAM/selenodomain-associated transferase 2
VAGGVSVSVVIPVLDERAALDTVLGCTRRPGVERIVVDGGSSDGTAQAARVLGAEQVIAAPALGPSSRWSEGGRARQMDAGFRAARGKVVLFLHADTRLDPTWLDELRAALAEPGIAGGAFRFALDAPLWRCRVWEAGVALRARLLRLPYGDQALFVRRDVLAAAGGIAPTPIFEDLDLVRLIRRHGRLALLRARAWTSPRRYERNGWLRQTARNLAALAGWYLGLSRADLARWYRARPSR